MKRTLRGFSLAEVLIALLIASIVLAAGLVTLEPYVSQLRWLQLSYRLGLDWHEFRDRKQYNVFYSSSLEVDDQHNWYMYFESSSEPKWWMFESFSSDVGEEKVVHQKAVFPEVYPIRLKSVELMNGEDRFTANHLLVRWNSDAFSPIFMPLGSSILDGDAISLRFSVPDNVSTCTRSHCAAVLTFQEAENGRVKEIVLE